MTRPAPLRRLPRAVVGLGVGLAGLVACGDDAPKAVIDVGDGGRYQPAVDAANFVDRIDNPYLPLAVGAHWVLVGRTDEADGGPGRERVEITVTGERRTVQGVSTFVVHDVDTVDGTVVEDTYDWMAQDRKGTVWYFGEQVKEIADGKVSHEGSWEAGKGGAKPGVAMPAGPRPGQAYRQEFDPGNAEDLAKVSSVGATLGVPFGSFRDVLVIREWTPLEPDVVEVKYYARNVGIIREATAKGGEERADLVEYGAGT